MASARVRPNRDTLCHVHRGSFVHRRSLFRSMRPVLVHLLALVLGASATVSACGPARDAATASPLVDDFGDTIRRGAVARRIVSLNPVTTEFVLALGERERLVGRTHWDLFTEESRSIPDVGDGMMPNVEAVLGQRPDLVLLYATESNRAAAQQLRRAGVATLSYRTDHVSDLARVGTILAEALGRRSTGARVLDSVAARLDSLRALPAPARRVRAFWHVWDAPVLTIGKGSYLSELLEIAGGENVFADIEAPSPQVTLEEIARRDPDVILAGPNSAATMRAHQGWQAIRAVREGRILVIDTTLVGRPGVRMGEAAEHLRALLYPPVPR